MGSLIGELSRQAIQNLRVLLRWTFTLIPFCVRLKVLAFVYKPEERHFITDDIAFSIQCVRGGFDYGKNSGVHRNGRYEEAMSKKFIDCLKKLNRKESVFIDIGAGIGYYSILASQILRPQNIHAFEPDIIEQALFQVNNNRYCNGAIKVNRLYIASETKKNTITLDEYCANNHVAPDIIKMDIEGMEYYAIDGWFRRVGEILSYITNRIPRKAT